MDLEAKESAALREIGHEQALMREEQHGKLAEDLLVNKTSGRKVADEPQENDALWGDDLWGDDEDEDGGFFAAPVPTLVEAVANIVAQNALAKNREEASPPKMQ